MQCLEKAQNESVVKQFPRFSNAWSLVETLKPDYSIYCLRPQILADTAKRFIALFPGKVMYAVKCNPHPLVLDALCQGGINRFDAASSSANCCNFWVGSLYAMCPKKSALATSIPRPFQLSIGFQEMLYCCNPPPSPGLCGVPPTFSHPLLLNFRHRSKHGYTLTENHRQ